MLTLLAMMLQTAPNDADTSRKALACSMAAAVVGASENPIRTTSKASYFLMQAAKADPGSGSFMDRISELTEKAGNAPNTIESAKVLMQECDSRFPLASATAPAKLPADPFQRDMMCVSILGLLSGAAKQFEEDSGDAGPLDKIETAMAPISDRLTDAVLTTHGISSQASFETATGDQLKASLDLGNPEAVARGCGMAAL